MLLCLKCDRRFPDDHTEPCECGAREWACLNDPIKPYTLSQRDRIFLKTNRIAPEV